MSKFAEPYADILRRNLMTVVAEYMTATGRSETKLSQELAADGSFLARWRRGEGGFRVQTYDDVIARLSLIWPEGVAWPEGIPRLAPKQISPTKRKKEGPADGQKVES